MKHRQCIAWICCLFLLLTLLPVNSFAYETRSSDIQRDFEGGKRDFQWPIPGRYNLTGCFMDENRRIHSLDIDAHTGDLVVASFDGTVEEAFKTCTHKEPNGTNCCNGTLGNCVVLKHEYQLKNGKIITLYTRYSHLDKVLVDAGQSVTAGTQIGTVGTTGFSTGAYLQYEVLYGGNKVSSCWSIDPYANELLELPSDLRPLHYATNKGQCCEEYISFAKEVYHDSKCSHPSYDAQEGKCTACGVSFEWRSTKDSSAMGLYVVVEDTVAYSTPYEYGPQTQVEKGQVITVSAVVSNATNRRWYEMVNASGAESYVKPESVLFLGYLQSEIKGDLTNLKNGTRVEQRSQPLFGSVVSRYPLRTIIGYLDGAEYARWEGNGADTRIALSNTELNQQLPFGTLSVGTHTLEIMALDINGWSETVISRSFNIVRNGNAPALNLPGDTDIVIQLEALPVLEYEPKIVINYATEQGMYEYIEKGQSLGELAERGSEDPDFLGWYTAEAGGERVTADTVPETHITLYPRWISTQCILTCDETIIELSYGATVTLPQPTKEGHTFLGWFSEDGEKMPSEIVVTQNMQLYSRWEADMCIITLNPAGGSIENDQIKVGYGEPYGELPTPVRKGYRFTGWQLRGRTITANVRVTEGENHTLVAVWEKEASPLMWIVPVAAAVAGIAALVLYILHRRRKAMEEYWESM